MIDKIVRKNYNEFWIIYLDKPPRKVVSSGNAFALLEFLLYGKLAW